MLQAIEEYDELGGDRFLQKYGFGRAKSFWLRHDGNRYDSKAIVGAAFGFQHPDRGPLSPAEFSAGEKTVQKVLEGLGFAVEIDATLGQLAKRFRNLRVGPLPDGRKAPHKPLLALRALVRVAEGRPRLTRVADVADDLSPVLRLAVTPAHEVSVWEPIWRLEHDVWELKDDRGDPRARLQQDAPPISELRAERMTCGLTEEVYDALLEQPEWVAQLQEEIIDHHLSDLPHDVVLAALARSGAPQAVWWVNQGRTYSDERDGGYIWAPSVTKAGRPASHHVPSVMFVLATSSSTIEVARFAHLVLPSRREKLPSVQLSCRPMRGEPTATSLVSSTSSCRDLSSLTN